MLVFDANTHDSFESLEDWLAIIRSGAERAPVFVVANKTDLRRAVAKS
jgi:GTPase SAR1 family protein